MSFHDCLSANVDGETDITEVLSDEEMVQLVSGTQELSEDADDLEASEACVPAPDMVMDAIDLIRWFAGAHDRTKDVLKVRVCSKRSIHPMLTKCHWRKSQAFQVGNKFVFSRTPSVLLLFSPHS